MPCRDEKRLDQTALRTPAPCTVCRSSANCAAWTELKTPNIAAPSQTK
jgi:hypothetical protein